MDPKRNLDITRIKKGKDHTNPNTGLVARESLKQHSQKRLSYFGLLAHSWRSVFDSKSFQLSMFRNLFSLRTALIAVLPALYFQITYVINQKPDYILSQLKGSFAPQNTSSIIAATAALLVFLMLSLLFDTIAAPALSRYYFQKYGNRNPKMGKSVLDSLSISLAIFGYKAVKFLIFIITLSIALLLIIGLSQLFWAQQGLRWLVVMMTLILTWVFLAVYFNFKGWLMGGYAVGPSEGRNKLIVALERSWAHPISSFFRGTLWLATLILISAISLAWSIGAVFVLMSYDSLWLQITVLSLSSVLVFLSWSVWTSWQAGYWSKIIEHENRYAGLRFVSIPERRLWQFGALLMVLLLIIFTFILLAFGLSDKMINLLSSVSSKIPESLRLNIPKPQ